MLFNLLDQSPGVTSLGLESHLLWDMYHPIERAGFASHAVGAGDVAPGERRALAWTLGRIAGGGRYLDKFPRNCLRVEYLNALYPDAQFVYIVRDGRPAVSSMMTAWKTEGRFGAGTTMPVPLSVDGYGGRNWKLLVPPGWREFARGRTLAEVCAFQWVGANQAVLAARTGVEPDRWLDVRYEDLVADPSAVARRLLAGLGLPGDEVLEWAANLGSHVSRTAITAPRPDKWRDEHPAEIESVLPMLAETMHRLGYDPATPPAERSPA